MTLKLVLQDYWWPQMLRYIGQYVSICDVCVKTKPIQYLSIGKLYSLTIPDT